MGLDLSSALNGIRSAITRNNVRSNNIANVNSKGYKSRRADQTDSAGSGPEVKSVIVDVSQGSLKSSESPMDLAIEGKGFFEVENSDGQKLYTRSLRLQVTPEGRITDQSGNKLPGVDQTLEMPKDILVEHDGTVLAQDENGETFRIGKIMVMNFSGPQHLNSAGNGYYQADSGAGVPVENNSQAKVLQQMQEMSNVDLAEQITGQIVDEAALKANINTIKTQDDMLGDVIDLQG